MKILVNSHEKGIHLVFEATIGYARFNADRQLVRLFTDYHIVSKADLLAAIDNLRVYVMENVHD